MEKVRGNVFYKEVVSPKIGITTQHGVVKSRNDSIWLKLTNEKRPPKSPTASTFIVRFRPYPLRNSVRCSHKGIHCNAMMTEKMLHEFAEPDAPSMEMLRMAMERLKLSARAYSRILKVARTIADLDGSEKVQSQHIAEAIGYRNLDRGDWAERGI